MDDQTLRIPRISRSAKTRAALLDSGKRLFAEHPFDAVAIDDIVRAAGVAKGTFYNHFIDKDDLIEAIVSEIRRAIENRILRVNESVIDAPVRIARAVCVYAASASDEPGEGQILLRNDPRGSGRQALNDGLRADIGSGLRSGRIHVPTLEAGLVFVIGISHGLLLSVSRNPERVHTIIIAQQLCNMMLRALGVPPQEAELISAQAADAIIGQREHALAP